MAKSFGLVLLCLALLLAMAGATQFQVGGSMGWGVPADHSNAMSYNQWAEKNRFKIGDSLLFVYPSGKDSVLQVDQDSYNTCNTSSYVGKIFDDGHTVFTLDRSGPFYFISGVEANCLRKESLVIVVMADRSRRDSVANQPSLPPSPAPEASSSTSPPPSPVDDSSNISSPPPPPPGSEGVTPSAAPTGEESSPFSPSSPTPNGANLKVVGFMSSLGTLLGWVMLVL
ncbi:early nodulin-like protein 9 [Typha angustifolia]|uniref:early nodulin-like protein 9 n=1 Tax=Typha angustifolia TaxID=59011 RepID=UPI003C300DA2